MSNATVKRICVSLLAAALGGAIGVGPGRGQTPAANEAVEKLAADVANDLVNRRLADVVAQRPDRNQLCATMPGRRGGVRPRHWRASRRRRHR